MFQVSSKCISRVFRRQKDVSREFKGVSFQGFLKKVSGKFQRRANGVLRKLGGLSK